MLGAGGEHRGEEAGPARAQAGRDLHGLEQAGERAGQRCAGVGASAGERFEQLFGTPHGTDIVALAAAHRLDAATVDTEAALTARLSIRGPSVTRVATDRAANVAIHADINRAVAQAITGE